jgi:choline dehydrogenase-like flavoprotein
MQRLGEHSGVMPQNCSTPEDCVKHCTLGCISGGKNDTARAFLAPVAASGNLTLLTRAAAHQVLTVRTAGDKPRRATGALLRLVCSALSGRT